MRLDKKTLNILWIMLLAFWLSFLFLDSLFSQSQETTETLPLSQQELTMVTDTIAGQLDMVSQEVHEAAPSMDEQLPSLDPNVQQSVIEDIRVLEYLYNKNPDTRLLTALIQRLATNYQFADANKYLQLLMQNPDYERMLSVHVILSVLLHADDVAKDTSASVDKILPLIEQYRNKGLLSADDYVFYRGLLAVRSQKYADASQIWASLATHAQYGPIVATYEKALQDFSGSLHVPAYYQDALVGLAMLKNGYFSIAKKLALVAVMKDNDYLLPYQILAYANFLSSNRDVSAEYFLKLSDFDKANTARYIFLAGVSYYRQEKYEQAILFLNQVTDPALLTDVYRYEVLSFLAMDDHDGAVRLRQKLLGQGDLQDSDFMQFFDSFFYQPYVTAQPFALYNANKQLAASYLQECARSGSGSRDVCIYGEVGQILSTSTWAGIADKLVYLSSTYHQSALLQVLGDYYVKNNQYGLAKDAYSQALVLVASQKEESLLQAKLQKVLDAK